MNKLTAIPLTFALISLILFSLVLSLPVLAQSSSYKLDGYVRDSNGTGVAGANVNFNGAIPSVQTNNAGYYSTYAPAGTYHMYIWPPFDSVYINYDEAGITISSNVNKNITLSTGCKISGYVTNSSGSAMVGASVLLKTPSRVYGSGWFTNTEGYYFINVPAGSYTLDAHPQTAYDPTYKGLCTPFTTYYEYNFDVSASMTKNIIVDAQTSVTTTPTTRPNPSTPPNPTSSPTAQPTAKPTPTPKPTLPLSYLSILTEASNYQVGTTLNVKGTLTDQNGNPLNDRTIILSYSVDNGATYSTIGSGKTDTQGRYIIQWLIQASGTFKLKSSWIGKENTQGSENATMISFLPYQGQSVFFVESNSTVTALTYDSTNRILGFNVTGQERTKGVTKVTISKTLSVNPNFSVYLDGKTLTYDISSTNDSWQLTFTYGHSTHQVTINTNKLQENNNTTLDNSILIGIIATLIIVPSAVILALRRSKRQ